MTRRNIIIGFVGLIVLWAVVFALTNIILTQFDEDVVDFETLPSPTPRPTREDVPELLAPTPEPGEPTSTPIPSATATPEEAQRPTPAFTFSPLELNVFQPENPLEPVDMSVIQPTLERTPDESGAYPIRLAIPDLGVLAAVLAVQTDANFDIVTPREEVGYYALTPKLGAGGNTVMIGHVYPGRVFNNLLDAQIGQVVRVTDEFYREHYYRVSEIIRFPYESGKPEDRVLGFQYMYDDTEERITLVTCYPEFDWTHRFVVRAVPIDPPGSDDD